MSDTDAAIEQFLAEPEPTTEAEFRAAWKRWYNVVPSIFLESLKVTAGQHDWQLEEE
jgi:hypothetical protein